jgi:phosphatidylinositol alpha-1,6-mannosyltransferase
VQEGITGHVVDGRLDDLAQATLADTLVGLLTDPDRRRRMGQAGRTWVQDRWAWERQAARLSDLLA